MAKYYIIPKELDEVQICYNPRKGQFYTFASGELLTPKECEKMHLNTQRLELLESMKGLMIYWNFGKRFLAIR